MNWLGTDCKIFYFIAKLLHVIKNTSDIWHHISTINNDRLGASVSESCVQHCSVFSEVDFLSLEHSIPALKNFPGLGL